MLRSITYRSDGILLMDPALYVKTPVMLRFNNNFCMDVTGVYRTRNQNWCFELKKGKEYDEYDPKSNNQVYIPAHTPTVYCKAIDKDSNMEIDSFTYYLREILNPDLSITVHTNYSDGRIFVASSDNDGEPLAYL